MAHEAIINFLFNSEGAIREIDNFKSRFSNALDGLASAASNVGKVLGVGGGLTSFFSVKDFMEHIKLIGDLNTLYNNLPINKIGRFANAMELLGSSDEEAVASLRSMQKMLESLRSEKGGKYLHILQKIGVQPFDEATKELKDAITLFEEIDESLRHGLGKTMYEGQKTKLFEDLGMSSDQLVAAIRYVNQTDDELKELNETLDKMWAPDESDVERLRKFNKSLATLQNKFRELGKTLLDLGLGNIIDAFNKAIEQFIKASPETQKAIIEIAGALMTLGPGIVLLRSLIGLLPLMALVLALLVAFNVGGLHDELDKRIEDFDKWNKELEKEHPILAAFGKQLSDFGKAMSHPWDTLKTSFSQIINDMKAIWDDFKKWLQTPFELPQWAKDWIDAVKKWFGLDSVNKTNKEIIHKSIENKKDVSIVYSPSFVINGEMSEKTKENLRDYSEHILQQFNLSVLSQNMGGINNFVVSE